jgi:ATP/maltotriose-dependent transcriptional regulator MalT
MRGEVLPLVVSGATNRAGRHAGGQVTRGTVKRPVTDILELGATNRTQAVAVARGLGLLA